MSTYTSSLGLEQITPGDQAGLWGNTTNNNLALIDQAVTGVTPISFAALSGQTYTLTDFDGAVDEARSAVLNITGIAAGPNTVVIPNKQKMYLVRNNTGRNVVFQTPTPTASYTVGAGNSILIFCDGNNNVFTGIASPSVGTLSVSAGGTGSTTFTAGFVKSTGGTNALTSATTVDLASEVSGVLSVPRGGTGAGTFTSGSLLIGNGVDNFGTLVGPAGVPGPVATWNGSQWTAATPASAGVTSVTAGTGINVSGPTGAVSISNAGVTSLTAGSGITITGGSTGALSISATGGSMVYPSAGIAVSSGSGWFASYGASGTGTTVVLTGSPSITTPTISSPSLTGTPTAPTAVAGTSTTQIATTAFVNTNYAALTGTNNFTGTNNYSTAASISMTGSSIGDQRITVTNSGLSSGLSAASLQLGAVNWGINYTTVPQLTINAAGAFSSDFRTSGNFQSNNSPNWATTSDINIKTNLRPINNALGKLTSLNPCHFEYKDEIGKTRSGFIAQEFETVFPGHTVETIVTEKYKEFLPEGVDTLKALDLNLVPYLVKAIQELKAELDGAKAEIAELKAK